MKKLFIALLVALLSLSLALPALANKNGKNLLVKGAVRINYSKQGFQRFMTYVDYCLNTTHLREYYCKKEGEGYGRLTASCPEMRQRSCAGGACSR